MFWIEIAATVFGFLCVALTIRRSVWCWPIGLVQVLLFTIIFYKAKLYSDLILHVIYVFMQCYGWYCWTSGNSASEGLSAEVARHTVAVRCLTHRAMWIWLTVAGLGTCGWGFCMQRWTDASLPYQDAFTTVASLIAQYLLAKQYWQNWVFWIAVDLVAIHVYTTKELFPTAVLYTAFLVLAVLGLVVWRMRLEQPFDKSIESCE
ncbi:MAG: nicotinamide riboside transporter PnuC [Pirellulaceae bacterium]